MISVMSGIVLMLAIGTLVQRGDVVTDFLTGGTDPVVLNEDDVTVAADTLTRIDVLANDENLRDYHKDKLVVLSQPTCGRVFVQGGALQYLGERGCAAQQVITYGLAEVADASGEVHVTVKGATGEKQQPEKQPEVVAVNTPAPAPVPTPQASVPARQPQAAAPSAPVAPAPAAERVARADAPMPSAPAPLIVESRAPSAPSALTPSAPSSIAPAAPAPVSTAAPSGLAGGAGPAVPRSPAPSSPLVVATAPEAPVSEPAAPARTLPRVRTQAPDVSVDAGTPATPSGVRGLASPRIDQSSAVAGLSTESAGVAEAAPGKPLDRATPEALGAGVATLALARIEVPTAAAAPSSARSQELKLNESGAPAPVASRSAPEIASEAGQQITMLEPSAGLGEILDFGAPLTLRPLDTSLPAPLTAPLRSGDDATDLKQAALQPSAAPVPDSGAVAPQAQPGAPSQPERVASLPRTDLACVVPPSITLDIRPAGETELVITSPCHADSVALLSYEGLSLGISIDRGGRGELDVLGFSSSSDATLSFADGEKLDFDLPFTGTERIERVALAWDAPVSLELHAFEFGSAADGKGHISPEHPSSFTAVRRLGGGYMNSYGPVEGVGQSVQIYSHWLRRGGETGVVKMYIDFASRHRDQLAGTCGDGAYARPSFTVVRSSRGRAEPPITRRLAAEDCGAVRATDSELIEAAVRDIIISQR